MKRIVPILLLASSLLGAATASASKPRCRLERIDPADLGTGELRLYANLVELEGDVDTNLGAPQFMLLVDGKPAGHATKLIPFSAANEPVDVAFVVETAQQYKPALEPVKKALAEFIEDQPRFFKAILVTYGSDLAAQTPLVPAASLTTPIGDLTLDEESGDVRMVDAVRLAMVELNKLDNKDPGKAPPRRLIVLVSDGLNARMDRDTFRRLGDDAAKAGLPIHSIAFSPGDERGPLLNLGELSKRSNGTFRWAKTAADIPAQLATLADEVRRQYVLTYAATVPSTVGHTFQLRCGDVPSNPLGGDSHFGSVVEAQVGLWQRLGAWRWAVYAVGALFGLLAVLFAIGTLMQTAARRTPSKPKVAKTKTAKPKPSDAGQKAAAGGQAVTVGTRLTLIAIGGAQAGAHYEVRGAFSVGKAPGHSLIVSDDPSVSSRHCELVRDGGGFSVRDLGSTNGTFVNNQRVHGAQRLGDGDLIRLGGATQFKVRID